MMILCSYVCIHIDSDSSSSSSSTSSSSLFYTISVEERILCFWALCSSSLYKVTKKKKKKKKKKQKKQLKAIGL